MSGTDALQAAASAPAPALTEGIYSLEDVRHLARTDLNFFAALCLPEVCTLPFPPYYCALWQQLTASMRAHRNFDKYALGFPRGHAKTLFVKLLSAYAVLETELQFVLIVGANQDRAKDILRDVEGILDSRQVRAVYGNWREDMRTDKAEFKFFAFGGSTRALAAAGQGTSIRGFNVGHMRPDFIVCDDAQTRECAGSVTESLGYIQWFFGTLLKAKNPTRCTYLYVGNMYRDLKIRPNLYACLLRNLQFSRYWKSFIVGAILADGKALWEELQPREQLLDEFEQDASMGQGEIYAAEVLNDPSYKPRSGLDLSRITVREGYAGELHQGSFIIIDPSGNKTSSDPTAIAYCEMFDGVPCVQHIIEEVLSPGNTIRKALELALTQGCSFIVCEAVGYQDTLLYWFGVICQQQGIHGIQFHPIQTGGDSKNSRILRSFQECMAGEVTFSRQAFAMWSARASAFDPHRKKNVDDVLDVVVYAPKVFLLYGPLLPIPGTAVDADWMALPVPPADESLAAF